MADDDIYSDCDSEGFVQDMRAFGVGQALPLDVRLLASPQLQQRYCSANLQGGNEFLFKPTRCVCLIDDTIGLRASVNCKDQWRRCCVQAEGIEADAAAYLRAVRNEAARIPHVCAGTRRHAESAQAATSFSHDEAEAATLAPAYDWTCTVVDNFVAARAQVQHDIVARTPADASQPLPHVGNRSGWLELAHSPHAQPYSSTLARIDNTLAAWCLRCLAEETAKAEVALEPQMALWMYGLMVRLEKPIQPSVAAVLRQVAVAATERRRALPCGDVALKPEVATEVAMYDTLRVLAGGFFGQDQHLGPQVSEYLLRTAQDAR